MTPIRARAGWIALAAGTVLTLVAAYRLATLSLVLGSEKGRWVYGYLYAFNARSLMAAAAALVICGAPLLLPADVIRRREWWLIAFLLVAGTATQLRLRELAPYSIGRMFESDGSNGYYGATKQYRASVLLRDFDRLRPTLTVHPRGNMPGKLAFVYALDRISNDPEMLARLVVVVSNLGGVLLYWFVRDLTGDAVTALTAFAFMLFVPAKLFFLPILNSVTPVLVIACLALWLRALQSDAYVYSTLLGAGLFAMVVFEPLPLVTGLVFLGIAANLLARGTITRRAVASHAAAAAVAFAAVALVARASMQFDVIAVFRHLMNDATAFNETASRPYGVWVWRNVIDFAIGAGLVPTCLLLAASQPGRWRDPLVSFAVSLGVAILVTDLLGVNRGEVIRLWIFFACLLQVPAAAVCSRLGRAAALATLAMSLLVGTLGTSMMAFAQP